MGRESDEDTKRIARNEKVQSLPEDMLGEILLRLPDSATAIRSGSVCKAWRSVVQSPEFITAFIDQHSSPSSYTMVVEFKSTDTDRPTWPDHLYYVLTVEGSEANLSATYLPSAAQRLESTCHDMMLMVTAAGQWYVCRPGTRHRHVIPRRSPLHERGGFRAALAARRNSFDFRILHVGRLSSGQYKSTVFSPESGRWSDPADAPALDRSCDVVAAGDGTLFWVEDYHGKKAVVFDPFVGNGTWRRVRLPKKAVTRHVVRGSGPNMFRIDVGVVRGRVRISQIYVAHFCAANSLKVWELEDTDTWRLVHHVQLLPDLNDHPDSWMFVLAYDPDDGDVVFLCRANNVFRLDIGVEERWVFKLSADGTQRRDRIDRPLIPANARAHIVTRTVWPTTAPTFRPAHHDFRFF